MADAKLVKTPDGLAEADKIVALVRRAERGDATAVPALREKLAVPGVADALGGDIARRVADRFLDSCCGKNLASCEAMAAKMAQLRAELCGANPTAVERLLADRAVLCWFQVHQTELIYASKDSMTLTLAQHYQKSIDRAHRRYLSSLKALTEVRKLNVTVQLNIARKQVNVAGAVVGTHSAEAGVPVLSRTV
ncbi:hypothetical protein J0H58_20215 [bacterium]|nr:hypothetical protein [bacterium]